MMCAKGEDCEPAVQCLWPVFFIVIVTSVRNVLFRCVEVRVSLESVPVLCLHLEVSSSKLFCTEKEFQ
jgi:hypothetical protein